MNSFGKKFVLTTFGESHGMAVGGVIDGCPAGLHIDMDAIRRQLLLRSPIGVYSGTERCEPDEVEFLSGIFNGVSLGTPITFVVRNREIRSSDYDSLRNLYRPGHADYTYQVKYGIRDYRGGGRASARETVARVVAGAVAQQWLGMKGIDIATYVDQIGDIRLEETYNSYDLSCVDESPLRCPDKEKEILMKNLLDRVAEEGDSIGGAVRCVITGVPAGLGNPVFGKLSSVFAAAMMSIPAAKGFEYGLGMDVAAVRGSESNDMMYMCDGVPCFKTNRSGGILGGITTGEDIYFRTAFKPVASIRRQQTTVTDSGAEISVSVGGRHDVCVAPRAVAVVKAMSALVLIDEMI